jgi:CHAT domain-containing protein
MGVIAPADSVASANRRERQFLLSLNDPPHRGVREIETGYETVVNALAEGSHDCIHFAGHGLAMRRDPDQNVIDLGEGEWLRPTDLYGRARRLGQVRPLVFLNACRTALDGLSLAGNGGWASAFIDVGAGAFLGTYWQVPDDLAHQFAKAFYGKFLSGVPFAEAVRSARVALRESFENSPSYLAYTAFGHPLARATSESTTP